MSYDRNGFDFCPKCSCPEIWQESVDIGVGVIHGPMGCPQCGWSEDEKYDLSEDQNPIDEKGGVTDQYGGYHPPESTVARGYRLADSFPVEGRK